MSPLPFDDDELRARCRKGTFQAVEPGWEPHLQQVRGPEGETLLHLAHGVATVRVLLAAGLDPNAQDRNGRTPLMYQAGLLNGGSGYSTPDFAALDALMAAGAKPPTREQAHAWITGARAQVSSAGEDMDCRHFARWILGAMGSSVETEPPYVVRPRVPKTLLPPEPTPAELVELADSDDEATREAVYLHPRRPTERIALLERVGAYPTPAVRPGETWFDWNGIAVGGPPAVTPRPAIALDPSLPFADFAFLLERGVFARTLVAHHPTTPPQVLARCVSHDPSPAVRIAAACHPDLPAEAMAAVIAAKTDSLVLRSLARHPALPVELQARLARSPLADVRAGMAQHTREAPLLERLADDASLAVVLTVAASAFTPPAVLERLAGHRDKAVREAVARHPQTPLTALAAMAVAGDSNMSMILANSPRLTEALFQKLRPVSFVMRQVVANPHAPESVLIPASEQVRASRDALSKEAVAASPRCPPEELEHYARAPELRIRAAVARNPQTPAALLIVLAADAQDSVRVAATKNPNCPAPG